MKFLTAAFIIITLLLAVMTPTGTAQAATGPFGRNWNEGYFTGVVQTGLLNWVFVDGAADPDWGLGPNCWQQCTMSEALFFQTFQTRVNDPDTRDSGRAAAIIDMMLGKQGPDFGGSIANGIAYARANFQVWENLVDLYDKGVVPGYTVNWNDFMDFTGINVSGMGQTNGNFTDGAECDPQSTYQCVGDISFFNTFNDPEFDYAVVFNAPGLNPFIIKHKCANLTGDSSGLPRPTTTINLSKSSSTPSTTVGSTIQYTIHAQEVAPIPLNTVTIQDTLPSEFTYTGPANGSPAPTNVSGQTLTWTFNAPADSANLTAITSGGGLDLSVNVKAVAAGNATNVANGSATDELNDNVPVKPASTFNVVSAPPPPPPPPPVGSLGEVIIMDPSLYLNPPFGLDDNVDHPDGALNGQGERPPLF